MDLLEIRNKIDEVDKSIVELYEKRMGLCKDVADYKISVGKEVLDRQREKEKIAAVTNLATNPDNRYGVGELFTQIMALSRKLQYKCMVEHGNVEDFGFVEGEIDANTKIVYQGSEGAYTHEAVIDYFGECVDCYHVDTWREVMEDIKNGKAEYGVFPIENSTAGIVNGVYDLLVEYDNYIVAEEFVSVRHALLGTNDATLDDIETVYSHPQALMQCSKYLEENKNWKQISYNNTANSAIKVASDNDKSQAAIASLCAAKLYGLKVLKKGINYNKNNVTRFVVISKDKKYRKEANKISICFELAHEMGSLYNLLSHLIYNGINMTKIESRPIEERNWEYRFFVDIEGRIDDPAVRNAFMGIKAEANEFRILGCF